MNPFRHPLALAAATCLVGVAAAAQAAPGDFTLKSADKSFKLSDARGKFVALHFLLKTECPICQRHVAETVKRGPERAGVVHVFIKPDSDDDVRKFAEKLNAGGVGVDVYRDPDAALADQFEIPNGYAFHGETVHFPATVLIGPDGKEVFRHVGKDTTDRLSFEQLAAKIDASARGAAIDQYNLSGSEPAIKGYDPVAYQVGRKPLTGKPEFASRYRGVVYRFESAENRALFASDPEKYVPQYGGWCATAMAEGRKVEIDPSNFKVTNGRLFLFYKGWLGDALKDWSKDEKGLTVKADEHWRKIAPGDGTRGG